MMTVHFGPTIPITPGQHTDFIRWWLFEIRGRIGRIGSKSFGDDRWPDLESRKKLEEAYKGKLVGMLIEPSFDHNGHFDPPGGFFWEDEYVTFARQYAEHLGVVQPRGFLVCPQCQAGHTALTRSCRTCGFQL